MLLSTLLILSLSSGLITGEAILNVAKFRNSMKDLARDALGKDRLQELVDTQAQFSTDPITKQKGITLADELSNRLSSRFAELFLGLEHITKAAEEAYAGDKFQQSSQYDSTFPQCCHLTEQQLEYDARFFTEADPTSVCYRISEDSPDSYAVPAIQEMLDVFKQNFQDVPTLKWQYFGTEEGIHLKFPAHVSTSCKNYDPRFRPWYVESSSPVPKDLVLVIDSSGSMETNNRMNIAKDAARTVVETLNPNDRIGLVHFSSVASTPPGNLIQSLCYNSEMAYAIPDNVDYLKSHIQDITATGQTAYILALEAAFELLGSVESLPGAARDKVILFLTDGEPTDSDKNAILSKIRELNSRMGNAVTIMTYGLSLEEATRALTEDLLESMARQDGADTSAGDINVGVFTKIDSVENLRFDLGSYYSHFSSKAALERPSISVPYVDFSGLGLISSICDTVLLGEDLKGVACLDVRIADIVGDIEFSQPGEYSYTFIIDQTGRTLIHPLMPSPFKVGDDPKFIDISVLERASEAKEIIQSMKRGDRGEKTFTTAFTVGMGHSMQHGVEVKEMEATYLWRPIANTDLALCMVFAASDEEVSIVVPGDAQHFLYHRFDVTEPQATCNHAGRLSTTEQSSVAFSDEAYADVRLLDSASLTPEDLQRLSNYMSTTGYTWDALKDGVKETVVLTEQMDAFWKSHTDKFAQYVSSRFIGTETGMFRVYPGIALAINYSHMHRPWYSDAVANRDKLVMSVPYVDAFRAGVVTSIMHSILEGKQSHHASDIVIGVIAADFNVAYIQNLLMVTYPQCQSDKYSCFLMDESGYLIVHPSLADETLTDKNRHIIKHEPEIATYLIGSNFMVRETCVSLGENKEWLTWKVLSTQSIEKKDSFLSFELHWVEDTNVYLGIKDTSSQTGAVTCRCPGDASSEFRCERTDASFCECPCYDGADYDYCSNSFAIESLPDKTCTPPSETRKYTSPVENEEQKAESLPLCFDVNCKEIATEWECSWLASCSWCYVKAETERKCHIHTDCDARAVTPSVAPDNNVTDSGGGGSGTNIYVIVGVVLGGGIVLIAVIAVVAVVLRRKRSQKQTSGNAETPGANELKYRPSTDTPLPPTPSAPSAHGHLVADGGYVNPTKVHTSGVYEDIDDYAVQRGPNGVQGGQNGVQGGPNGVQGDYREMQGGPTVVQGGPNGVQGGPIDQHNHHGQASPGYEVPYEHSRPPAATQYDNPRRF